MRHYIDLTKRNFDRIDFTEAKIVDFYCQRELPEVFEFTVWGSTLLLAPMWKHDEDFDNSLPRNEDMYVAGLGKINLTNLVGGSIEVYAYDNIRDENNRIVSAHNRDGSELIFKQEWKIENQEKDYDEYLWESVITWPYGFCILKLKSDNGKVTYEFDANNLVSATEFRTNPQKYLFD